MEGRVDECIAKGRLWFYFKTYLKQWGKAEFLISFKSKLEKQLILITYAGLDFNNIGM